MQLKKILALALLFGIYQSQLSASNNAKRLEHEKAILAALDSATTQERDQQLQSVFVKMYFDKYPNGTQEEADRLALLNIALCADTFAKDKAEKEAVAKQQKASN